MTIDDSERYLRLMLGGMKYAVQYWKDNDKEESDIEQTNVEAVETALDTMCKYQKIEADYNARLKADLVAILTEIQLEIEEQVLESLSDGGDDWFTAEKVNECLDIIDKHKAESEGEE